MNSRSSLTARITIVPIPSQHLGMNFQEITTYREIFPKNTADLP